MRLSPRLDRPAGPLARVALLWAALAGLAAAAPRALVTRAWGGRDGLPQSTVTSIAADDQGFLHLGTFAGVVRFDGQSFRTDETTPTEAVRVTAVAVHGSTVYFGTEAGGVWEQRGDHPHPISQPEPLKTATVQTIIAEPDGTLLISATAGVWARRPDGGWQVLHNGPSQDVDRSPDGTVAVIGISGIHWIDAAGTTLHTVPLQRRDDATMHYAGVFDAAGRYWVQVPGLLLAFTPEGVREIAAPLAGPLQVTTPLVDRRGHLWLGDRDSIIDLGPTDTVAASPPGRPVPAVARIPLTHSPRSLHEDANGVLWVGTSGGGLVRVAPRPWSVLSTQAAGCESGHGPLARGAGPLAGAACGSLLGLLGERAVRTAQGTRPIAFASALAHAPDGGFYVGANGVIGKVGPEPGAPFTPIAVGLRSRELPTWIDVPAPGRLRIGTGDGRLLEGPLEGPFTQVLTAATSGAVLHLLDTPEGTYVAGPRGIEWVGADGRRDVLTASAGCSFGAVRALAAGADGRVWVASYGSGLGWVDGRRCGRVPFTEDGLPDRFLSGVLVDGDGVLWAVGNRGLWSIPESALTGAPGRLAAHIVHYDVGEANGWVQPALIAPDSRTLGVATVAGIVHVDREAARATPPPARVSVDRVRFGGVDHPGAVLAPPDAERRLELFFSVPATASDAPPLVEWRLRARGAPVNDPSATWQGPERPGRLSIPLVAPGDWVLELRAIGIAGKRGPVTELPVVVRPRWSERRAVWVGGGLLVALGMVAAAVALVRRERGRARRFARELELRLRADVRAESRAAWYRSVFELSGDGLLVSDLAGRVVDANPAAAALAGLAAEEWPSLASLGLATAAEAAGSGPQAAELLRVDGGRIPVEVNVQSLTFDGTPRLLCSIRDQRTARAAEADRQRMRDAVQTSRRVEALGRLAGAVAHRMNNLLGAMLVQVHEWGQGGGGRVAAQVEGSVHEAAGLVRQLLAFGRRPDGRATAFDAAAVVRAMAPLLTDVLPPAVALRVDAAGTAPARMSRTDLEQALVHLVIHAAETIRDGGELRLRVHRPAGAGPRIGLDAIAAVRWLDDAPSSALLLGVVREAGLGLESPSPGVEPPHWELALPAPTPGEAWEPATASTTPVPVPPRGPEPAPPGRSPAPALPGRGPLLLVDDNEPVRRTVRRALERAGHRVVDCDDGSIAVEWLAAGERPALLITDVIMPGLSGPDLAQRARAAHPGLPVLFITGYSDQPRLARHLTGPHDAILEKPFTAERLCELVARTLAGAAAGGAETGGPPAGKEGGVAGET